MYVTKAVIFACRSKTLTSCSVTHCKNKMLMWQLIKKKPNSMWSIRKSSCKSCICSNFAASQSKKNTKLSNCKLTFSFSPWKVSWGDADTMRDTQPVVHHHINVHKQQDTKKALCEQIRIILFCPIVSLQDFPTIIHSKRKRGRPCGREDCRFPGQILTKSFPVSPVRILGPTFRTNLNLSVLSSLLVSAPSSCFWHDDCFSVLKQTTTCGHTTVRVNNTVKQWHH